jgi:hypothetical protein
MISANRIHRPTNQVLGGYAVPSKVIISQWTKLLENPSATRAILKLNAISQLGDFIESASQDLTAINPWQIHSESSPLRQLDVRNIISIWARKLHHSFANLEVEKIDAFLVKLDLNFSSKGDDLYKYFLVEQSDMRFRIIYEFSKRSYNILAPFNDCAHLFLFLSTNDRFFLKMVNSELIRQKFIRFSEEFIKNELCALYE